MTESLVEKNLQLRIALSDDIGRHIRESMQEWRNTLEKYSITLQDIKKQMESDHLSRDDALNEIDALLSRFHEADDTFQRFHTESKYLMDIDKAYVDRTLPGDVQHLVDDWYNLKASLDRAKMEAMPAESVEAVHIDSTSDVQVDPPVEGADADTLLDDDIETIAQIEPVSVNIAVPCAVEALKREVEEETLILPAEVAVAESCPDYDLEVNGKANTETEDELLNNIRDTKSSAEYLDSKPPRGYNNFCLSFCCCFVAVAVAVLLRFYSAESDAY